MPRQAGTVGAADGDPAGMRPLEAGEDIDEGGLAGAVRPDQAEHLAAVQSERDMMSATRPPKRTVTDCAEAA